MADCLTNTREHLRTGGGKLLRSFATITTAFVVSLFCIFFIVLRACLLRLTTEIWLTMTCTWYSCKCRMISASKQNPLRLEWCNTNLLREYYYSRPVNDSTGLASRLERSRYSLLEICTKAQHLYDVFIGLKKRRHANALVNCGLGLLNLKCNIYC